jgi:hypothetical protein
MSIKKNPVITGADLYLDQYQCFIISDLGKIIHLDTIKIMNLGEVYLVNRPIV